MQNYVDLDKAIGYVRNNGSEFDNAKLDVILRHCVEESKRKILEHYTLLQNENRGFPCFGQRGQITTISSTVYSLITLYDYDLIESEIAQNAIEFLLNKQTEEGYWDEPKELLEYNPPKWLMPGNINTILWETANACHLLAILGYIQSPHLTKGVDFLLQNRDESGQIVGYLQGNWTTIAVMGLLQGPDSNLTQSFISIIDKNLDKILGTSDVAWCLRCFIDGEIDYKHPIIQKMLENLKENQNSDGKWISVDGSDFDMDTTIAIIRIIKKLQK